MRLLGPTTVCEGNIVVEGLARRFIGDFSNATAGNRLVFQTSAANAVTDVAVMPSGTGTTAGWRAYNASDPNNASLIRLEIGATEALVRSGQIGTGSYLPLSFLTGNTSRFTISTTGKFSIGGAASAWDTDKTPIQFVTAWSSLWSHDTNKTIGICANYYFAAGGRTSIGAAASTEVQAGSGGVYIRNYPSVAANTLVGAALVDFNVTPAGAQLSTPQLLGYGTGAGGTVTQPTNKSTAVTLNKPCGRITTHNASLPGGTSVAFTFNNSLIGTDDGVDVWCSSPQNYKVRTGVPSTGSVPVYIENTTISGLSDALTINFRVLKGATS